MPELVSLLDRTTPSDLTPVDVSAIAATARRRSRRRRAGGALAIITVAGIVGGALAGTGSHRPDPTEQVTAESPDTRRLTPGMGVWEQLPDAPFAALSAIEPLADGRLLAWGDTRNQVGDDQEVGDAGLRIAVYDPTSRTWTTVDHPDRLDTLTSSQILVSDGRLLSLGMDETGVFSGAVLDVVSGRWTDVPRLTDVKVRLDAVAWDGTTLVVVRTDPGEKGRVGVGLPPHDVNDPDDGVAVIDYRVDAPLTRRWTVGDARWDVGAPPPLSPRSGVGQVFEDGTLVLVGGTVGRSGTSDPSQSRRDGARYEVASDTWTALPDLPWRAVHMGVGRVDGQLIVAGGTPSSNVSPGDAITSVVRLAADGSSWTVLPASPGDGAVVSGPHRRSSPEVGSAAVIQDGPAGFGPGGTGGMILLDGAWEPSPSRTFDDWDGLLVASSDRGGNGGDDPYDVFVRRGPKDWVPTAAAPFTDRMDPGVTVAGDRLYLVGGRTGPTLEPDATFWVLDLSGTR